MSPRVSVQRVRAHSAAVDGQSALTAAVETLESDLVAFSNDGRSCRLSGERMRAQRTRADQVAQVELISFVPPRAALCACAKLGVALLSPAAASSALPARSPLSSLPSIVGIELLHALVWSARSHWL